MLMLALLMVLVRPDLKLPRNKAARLAAVLLQHAHVGDDHAAVDSLAHVVNGEQRHLKHRRKNTIFKGSVQRGLDKNWTATLPGAIVGAGRVGGYSGFTRWEKRSRVARKWVSQRHCHLPRSCLKCGQSAARILPATGLAAVFHVPEMFQGVVITTHKAVSARTIRPVQRLCWYGTRSRVITARPNRSGSCRDIIDKASQLLAHGALFQRNRAFH